jgi:hypothetical protein
MMIDIRRNVVYSLFQFQPQGQPQAVASEWTVKIKGWFKLGRIG